MDVPRATPFRNRVTPWGELVAVPDRGTFTGNRGVLHDAQGRIVRRSGVRRWITCLLEFRDRRRAVMVPGRYTHLFFLDEATALAAGHRPCAECRWPDYRRFRDGWVLATGAPVPPGADAMDAVLDRERAPAAGRRPTWRAPGDTLPDGTLVSWPDGGPREAWLVRGDAVLRWTPGGYTDRRPRPAGVLEVITPRTTTGVLRAGYRPVLHPSAAQG